MKVPVVVIKKKDSDGEKVFDAFCPMFHDARTFSPCDDKNDAIDEVQEIVQDNFDELADIGESIPAVPSKDQLKSKYPDAKIVYVEIETTDKGFDEIIFDDDDSEDEEDDEDESAPEEDEEDDDYDEEMDDLLDDDE